MPWLDVIWVDGPGGNMRHIAQHDLTPEEVRSVLENPFQRGISRSSGLPIVWGYTPGGRFIAVVYEQLDPLTVKPVTAYEID